MTASEPLLRRRELSDLLARRRFALDDATLDGARRIVDDVRRGGLDAVIQHARRLGDLDADAPIILERAAMVPALERLDSADRDALESAAARIRSFAEAQRSALGDISVPIPGGEAGHRFVPMRAAGCYAPGGRHPLPSSALMTVIPARAAGVETVWLASPRASGATLAAAHLAGADGVLACGGAQAIAALAFGAGPVPGADVVAGPGNRWVTAAKQIVSSEVAIDMLAGPSEIVIIADAGADPELIAADLLAQAEHDTDAVPILITTNAGIADRVETALRAQLEDLPTGKTALAALANGGVLVVSDLDEAAAASEALAPEHLELMTRDDDRLAGALTRYGALFIGPGSAEVLGDYGAGPNHTLPTAGTAAHASGLSVLTFLTLRTWLRATPGATALCTESARLARMEGLEAHARAAEARMRW
ncbi:MAG: histidinol dehydrogenase [Phycisphaerales bacterium JB039]